MKSDILYVPKKQLEKAREEYKNKILRFVTDLMELGPWSINWDGVAKNQDNLNFAQKQNIFVHFPANPNIWYRKNNNIIFTILYDNFGNISSLPPFLLWKNFIQQVEDKFNTVNKLNYWKPAFDILKNVPFSPALFDDIQQYRTLLPDKTNCYGACMRNATEPMNLSFDFNDYKALNKPAFIVYSVKNPIDSWPGISELKKSQEISSDQEYKARLQLLIADSDRCKLPNLPNTILTDNTQGHWDLYWPEGKTAPEQFYEPLQLKLELQGRDPARDIQKGSVAIDFGTASTVVAKRDSTGKVSLVRVGVREEDLRKGLEPKHFENPTVLNFINIKGFEQAWREAPWRPQILWDDVQCSHTAKEGAVSHAASTFPGIKTWARGKTGDEPFAMTDEKDEEFEIEVQPPNAEFDPAKIADAKLDPIELYAFFLGLHLNNQLMDGGRIFTDYYLTFPLGFDRETRNRILGSFRRGLLRSLPASLIYSSGWKPENLKVQERANEPAAFAAAILPLLDQNEAINLAEEQKNNYSQDNQTEDLSQQAQIVQTYIRHVDMRLELTSLSTAEKKDLMEKKQKLTEELKKILSKQTSENAKDKKIGSPNRIKPTRDGVPFGVFDFGGGTTDFTVGLYRYPTEEEEDEGWEKVIDILDANGDPNLGGEHLVELMAHEVIAANMGMLLAETPIPFTKAADGRYLPGSEELFSRSSIAVNNMRQLCIKLRPLWEQDKLEDDDTGQIGVTFKDRTDKDRKVNLNVNKEQLRKLLQDRIYEGVRKFFATTAQALKKYHIVSEAFHIILAGNSCKSPYVSQAFQKKYDKIRQNNQSDVQEKILLYPPRLPNDADPEGVTLKTGVAIGLLNTLDDEPLGIVERNSTAKETPFAWYVGPMVEDRLKPALKRNSPYGDWQEFGKARKTGKIKVLYTQSPLAIENEVRRGENCREETIDFGEGCAGKMVVIKPTSPDTVVLALRDGDKLIENSEREIKLQK